MGTATPAARFPLSTTYLTATLRIDKGCHLHFTQNIAEAAQFPRFSVPSKDYWRTSPYPRISRPNGDHISMRAMGTTIKYISLRKEGQWW